jgi:hypothetical protein
MIFLGVLVLAGGLFKSSLLLAETGAPVARIVSLHGSVQLGHGASTHASRPAQVVHDQEIVSTAASSWVLLELYDATRLVIGPDSEMKIGMKVADNRHYLNLTLNRGLLRIVTGLACNRDIRDCVLKTPYGPLRLFEARADIWVCEDDCSGNTLAHPPTPQMAGQPEGRVVYTSGYLFLVDEYGTRKRLLPDDAVYLSDELLAGPSSCAVIAFHDGSILSLGSGQRVNASDPALRRGAGACPDWSPESGLDFRALFARRDASRLSHGVFARVVNGHVRLGDESTELGIGRGESAYLGNGPALRITAWPQAVKMEQAPDPYMLTRKAY